MTPRACRGERKSGLRTSANTQRWGEELGKNPDKRRRRQRSYGITRQRGESGDGCAWPSATEAETGGEFVSDLEKSRPLFRRGIPVEHAAWTGCALLTNKQATRKASWEGAPHYLQTYGKQEGGALGESCGWQWCRQI